MKKHPLAWLTFIFSFGIFIASWIRAPFYPLYFLAIAALISTALFFKRSPCFNLSLSCLVFLLGALNLITCDTLPGYHIAKYVNYYRSDTPYIIKGYINNQPQAGSSRSSFIFKAEEIQAANLRKKACGNMLVYVKGKQNLSYADELILIGNLYRPFTPLEKSASLQKGFLTGGNKALKSYRNYLYNQGIYAVMYVKPGCGIVRVGRNRGFALKKLALGLKKKIENIIFKQVSYLCAGVLDAMLLGEKRYVPAYINKLMLQTGTVHILVVSGFNVGIVAFIVFLILKILRVPRKARIIISLPLLALYCLATGASNPVLRATLMAAVLSLAYFFRREPDMYHSLAIAALVILSLSPRQLFDIGFQLSFVSVLSIVYLYPKIKTLTRLDGLKIRWIRLILDNCLVSLSAWLGTLGFIAYYFKIFSPVTVLANLLIVPLATLITLCGFALAFISLLSQPLAQFFAAAAELLVALLFLINTFLAKLPFACIYLAGRG